MVILVRNNGPSRLEKHIPCGNPGTKQGEGEGFFGRAKDQHRGTRCRLGSRRLAEVIAVGGHVIDRVFRAADRDLDLGGAAAQGRGSGRVGSVRLDYRRVPVCSRVRRGFDFDLGDHLGDPAICGARRSLDRAAVPIATEPAAAGAGLL